MLTIGFSYYSKSILFYLRVGNKATRTYQPGAHSQWESRKISTSPVAARAPANLARISPLRSLVRTIRTTPSGQVSLTYLLSSSPRPAEINIHSNYLGSMTQQQQLQFILWKITIIVIIIINDSQEQVYHRIIKNVMDKIWDRNDSKSEVIGRCGGDEKTEWPRRKDKSRTLKKLIKIESFIFKGHKGM